LHETEEPVGDRHVDVVAAEERVARRRDDLVEVRVEPQHGDVERAAAEIVDRDVLVPILPEAERERRRRRLVEDAETSSPAMIAASRVAFRCWSLKYAGTVMTAFDTASPSRPRRSSSCAPGRAR
jgi:hypothetical protein